MSRVDNEFGDEPFVETARMPVDEPRRAGDSLSLLVIGEGVFATHTLPREGEVVLGRSGQSNIKIDHTSISRRHAAITLGATVTVRDLGSSNGTKLAGRRLDQDESAVVGVGDVIEIGSITLIVQAHKASTRPRRIWAHGYFEGRVEDECARAERAGASFAVVRVHVDASGKKQEQVEQSLAEAVRAIDLVAVYGPGEYELLLIEATRSTVDEVVGRLTGLLASRDIKMRCGVALYPSDGRDADQLIARACSAVRGKTPVVETALGNQVIVHDASMQRLHQLVERIGGSSISVLLLGETGVGKEVIAETLHRLSPRAQGPLLRLNCAALSETLLESELFGHEKGAFTGAVAAKQGLLESAEGGTVFLDETGELPMAVQVKLLRVLEERQVTRVGGLRPRAIDVRFVSATNRDLELEIERGTFRQDLYFRLNGISLVIPPLRERVSEIEPLVKSFIRQACRRDQRASEPVMSAEALAVMKRYRWPGNIRELRNVVERAVLLCVEDTILPEHLPLEKMTAPMTQGSMSRARPTFARASSMGGGGLTGEVEEPTVKGRMPDLEVDVDLDDDDVDDEGGVLRSEMEAFERQRIIEALDRCGGNQTDAAKMLGISRRTLVTRLNQYQITRPRKGRSPTS